MRPARGLVRALLLAGASLGACATAPPGAAEELDLAAPTTTTEFWAESDGRAPRATLRLKLGGGRLAGLRVAVVASDGKPAAAAPEVAVLGTSPRVAVADGATAALSFEDAPLADGSTLVLDVVVPEPAPTAYRLRFTPVVRL